MSYGLPTGTRISYGAPGFPQWVYQLADHFGLRASTYPGHQESNRNEAGFAPNPQRLNRGIDWSGSVADMQRFADYLMTVKSSLEQVIWENPTTGQRAGVAGGRDVTNTGYYAHDYGGHRDHVHTRQSQPIPTPAGETPVSGWRGDPTWLETVLKTKLGDRLVVHNNWQLYGTGAGPGGQMGDIWGVMMHHTGNANEKPETIRNGVQQPGGFLRGPLSQCLITPDGRCHLVAIGPCNHAGAGSYPGLGTNNGNSRTIGIECAWPTIRPDGSYDPAERWPDAQIITMREVAAAIVARLGYGAERVIGHKEYAGAAQGKWDPGNLDMGWFRAEVAKDLRGEFDKPAPPPPPPTPQEPPKLGLPRLPFDTERALLEEILRQQRGPYLKGWSQLGDLTVVDSLALLHRKVDRIAAALDVDLTETD